MNTTSLFPGLLAYHDFGPLVIRVLLGAALLHFGTKKLKRRGDSSGSNSQMYGVVEILVGLFYIIGLFTQLAALLNSVILIIKLGFKSRAGEFLSDGINYYVLLLAMAVSLLFTGAGAYAFDMPL